MVQEQLAIQTVDSLETTRTAAGAYEGVIELVTSSPSQLDDIRAYEQPRQDAAFPLEYAFHLLNGVYGRTVVDLGCGSGLNTVILARLGARVISIDNCDSNLKITEHRAHAHGVSESVKLVRSSGCRIPAADGSADRVLCQGILQYSDPLIIARQIRRILKPGGRAVFREATGRALLPTRETALTNEYAGTLARAVGIPGRLKEFWLTTNLLCSMGVASSSPIGRAAQRFDAALFRRFPVARLLASSLVWEARKES